MVLEKNVWTIFKNSFGHPNYYGTALICELVKAIGELHAWHKNSFQLNS